MGILEKLLNAKVPAGVSSVDGFDGAITVVANAPITKSSVDRVVTLNFSLAGQTRGTIPMVGASGWQALLPGSVANSFLMSNGSGSNLSYTAFTASGGALILTPGAGTFDFKFGFAVEARGDIPVRGTVGWQRLIAPAIGQYLRSNGAGQVPIWGADLNPTGDVILTASTNRIRYGTSVIVDSDGTAAEFGNAAFAEAVVHSSGKSMLSANAGYQVAVFPNHISLFDNSVNSNNTGIGHVYIKNATAVPTQYAGGPTYFGTGGKLVSKNSAGVLEYMAAEPGARVLAGLFVAPSTGVAATTQIGKRSWTVGTLTFDVLVP